MRIFTMYFPSSLLYTQNFYIFKMHGEQWKRNIIINRSGLSNYIKVSKQAAYLELQRSTKSTYLLALPIGKC